MGMNTKRLSCILALLALLSLPVFAADKKDAAEEVETPLTVQNLIAGISSVSAPYISGDYVVFTADKHARFVGIAFDYEDFKIIHPMQLKTVYDMDFEPIDSVYFYILTLPKTVQDIDYRLVIDGLWTTDPSNSSRVYNPQIGLYLSHLDVPRSIPTVTEKVDAGTVRFIYKGATGQQVRLGGSFTNWDSWIYTMTETRPGVYEINIPLAPGKYEYAFYTGISSVPDFSNPERVYTADGRIASLLIVK